MSNREATHSTKDNEGETRTLGAAKKARLSFHLLNRTAMAIVVTASLAVGTFGLGTSAEARVNGPRLDSLSAGCGILQDEADGLRAEYANPNTSNARRGEILDRLRSIGRDWNAICRGTFGDISYLVVDVDQTHLQAVDVKGVQAADPGDGGNPGHFDGSKAGKLTTAGLRRR